MTTYTIEITDIPDDLLLHLDQQAQKQAKDRSAYIRDLLRRDLAQPQACVEASTAGKAFAENSRPHT